MLSIVRKLRGEYECAKLADIDKLSRVPTAETEITRAVPVLRVLTSVRSVAICLSLLRVCLCVRVMCAFFVHHFPFLL